MLIISQCPVMLAHDFLPDNHSWNWNNKRVDRYKVHRLGISFQIGLTRSLLVIHHVPKWYHRKIYLCLKGKIKLWQGHRRLQLIMQINTELRAFFPVVRRRKKNIVMKEWMKVVLLVVILLIISLGLEDRHLIQLELAIRNQNQHSVDDPWIAPWKSKTCRYMPNQ